MWLLRSNVVSKDGPITGCYTGLMLLVQLRNTFHVSSDSSLPSVKSPPCAAALGWSLEFTFLKHVLFAYVCVFFVGRGGTS